MTKRKLSKDEQDLWQKVAKTAEANDMAPKEFCDKIAAQFEGLTATLNISNDGFIRTTEPRHYEASKAIWNAIKNNSPEDIYLGQYEGWYSVRDEAYFAESELTTGKDTDGNDYKLAPGGAPVEWVEQDSYFFRLSAYGERLLQYYDDNPDFIQPASRRNEIISFVKGGLQDISISRNNFKWGVPVPEDEEHVMYVWLDALTNYLTGVGYPDLGAEDYQAFWPADCHIIGKDIIRFHCVYWPAFLMAAELPLPKTVFAHGFINVEGQKMSKSIGNVIAPQDLIDAYGLDQTRYILMREVPHGEDGNFSHDYALQRLNSDLANGLGNLAQRTLSMIYKNCKGKIPDQVTLTDGDKALLNNTYSDLLPDMRARADTMKFNRVLERIWRVVNDANAYVDEQAPWVLKKSDPARMQTVLYVLAEIVRMLGIVMQPFTPEAAAKMLDQLQIGENERTFAYLTAAHALEKGKTIEAPEGVFPRLEAKAAA